MGFVQARSIVFEKGHTLSGGGGEGLECVVFVVTLISQFNALFSIITCSHKSVWGGTSMKFQFFNFS